MPLYWVIIILGTLLIFAFWKRSSRLSWRTVLTSLSFAVLFGLLLSKLVYILTQAMRDLLDYGPEILFETDPSTFSFFGGAAGVLLGIVLACRFSHEKILPALDAFAPFGAFLIAVFRSAEYCLGTLGAGPMMMDSSPLASFPFALFNNYQEPFFSVPFLEILFACLCGILFLLKSYQHPGMKLEASLFYLALPQIFCESLRLRCMKWGFVRVEQVFCGVLMLALIWYSCSKRKSHLKNWFHRYERVLSFVLLSGLVVSVEYALDKSALGIFFCYAMMLGTLTIMGFSYASTIYERN